MLGMMNETEKSLGSTQVDWSAEALDFMKATASESPDVLSDVSSSKGPVPIIAKASQHAFVNFPWSAKVLTPLCTLSHLQIPRDKARQPRQRVG